MAAAAAATASVASAARRETLPVSAYSSYPLSGPNAIFFLPLQPTSLLSLNPRPHRFPLLSLRARSFAALPPLRTSGWAQPETEEAAEAEASAESEGEGFQWEEGEEEGEDISPSDFETEASADGTGFAWEDGEDAGEKASEFEDGAADGGVVAEAEEVGEGELYAEPPEEAKLFVGNLPYDLDSERLAQLFDGAGVVEVAEVIYNRETDQSRGFGFVTMSTVEEAEKAVEKFHRYEINGRLLTVNKAAPRGARVERAPRDLGSSLRLYVGNLPWQVDDSRLEQVFSEHGKVVEARVVYDRESGRSRGFGFVTMASKEELDDAIAALDGQSVDGRALRVNVAEERPRRF